MTRSRKADRQTVPLLAADPNPARLRSVSGLDENALGVRISGNVALSAGTRRDGRANQNSRLRFLLAEYITPKCILSELPAATGEFLAATKWRPSLPLGRGIMIRSWGVEKNAAEVCAGLAVGYLGMNLHDDAVLSGAISLRINSRTLGCCWSALDVLFDERLFRREMLSELALVVSIET